MTEYPEDNQPNIVMDDYIYDPVARIWWKLLKKENKMKKVIAEAKLTKALFQSGVFLVDDRRRGLYMNLTAAPKAAATLEPYIGQIVTISVEVLEQLPCCSPDFEERVLEVIRGALREAL